MDDYIWGEHMEDTEILLVASEEIAATAVTEPPGREGSWYLGTARAFEGGRPGLWRAGDICFCSRP